jgi:hypothetical protein
VSWPTHHKKELLSRRSRSALQALSEIPAGQAAAKVDAQRSNRTMCWMQFVAAIHRRNTALQLTEYLIPQMMTAQAAHMLKAHW